VSISDIDLNNITIEFQNVSFRYPNSTAYVLKNINLKINSSERLGIVGYNGSGKTTLTLLLTRMYDPTEGTILVNGIDIKNIRYKDYQRLISSVNQDFSLMSFSIIENIIMDDNISDEIKDEVMTLLEKNGLGERIKKLYRGLNTPITKKLFASGVDFSGGEMQRIAISRAQYKQASILILDEPTSALDPKAESELFKKFTDMSEGKTTILVSHRIYSTRFCDKIAVLDKGELKECGTFNELMKKKGLYYAFFEQQAEYFK
jgi:ABC-type multidrug transport system fused ATPase/permease subunit